MISVIVNLAGLLLIASIIWWFWLSKREVIVATKKESIEIKVKDGAYQPAYIVVEVNQPFTLRFIREDASPCAETVVFNALNISEQLPLNILTNINLVVSKVGEYDFTCQMGMYRGKLIVKN